MISTTTNRMDCIGTGGAGPFPYTFMIYDKTHLKVYVDGLGPKVVDTDYTVSGIGIGTGNVTFLAGHYPILNSDILIIRDVPLTQVVDYIDHSAFSMDILEKSLDYLTMISQQFNELIGRVVKVPVTSLLTELALPEAVAGGELIRWKADKTALDLVTIGLADVLNVITTQGDLIIGGVGGIAERKGIGALGKFFKSMGPGANPDWADFSDLNPINLVRNGSFENWSAGVAVAPDYWTLTGAAATVGREAAIFKHSLYSAKVTRAGTDCHLSRDCYVDMGSTYIRSRIFTFGAWVYAAVANRVRLRVNDGVTTSYSSYHTGGSTWEFLTVTVTAGAAVTAFTVGLAVDTGNTSGYIDGAMLIEGSTPFPFSLNPREWIKGGLDIYDKVVQVVNTQTGAVATGTTIMPEDDSIPQKTEGDECMTLAITPKLATNYLVIQVCGFWAISVAQWINVALFQDDIADALAVSSIYIGSNNGGAQIPLFHKMVAGTTSETTFKVRVGPGGAATITFNGVNAARLFGDVFASSITIKEVVP